jgi:N12 class adenine-specific DNA methylase
MKDRLASLGKRDKVVTFDELGIDAMFVDELHEFKNLFYNSTMERVRRHGQPGGIG